MSKRTKKHKPPTPAKFKIGDRVWVRRFQKGLDGTIGLVTGAVQGAFFGIMAVAFIGAVLGSIAGFILRRLFQDKKWLQTEPLPMSVRPELIVAEAITV